MSLGRSLPAILVTLVVAVFLSVGCAAAPTATPTPTLTPTATATATPTPTLTPTPTAVPTATPTPTATPIPLFPLTIEASNGESIIFQSPPQRIVALDSPAVEILYAIGAGDRLVGTHEYVFYPLKVADVPKVGDAFNLNVERIAELEPDLIYTVFDLQNPQLAALGVPVLYLASPTTLAEIPERMRMWGRITGQVEAGEKLARATEASFEELADKLASVGRGPRVFHDLGDFWTTGPDTFQGDMYRFLKAENVAHDVSGWTQISAEVLVERDPEVVVASFGAEAYEDNPALASISAVKNGRVHSLDVSLTTLISVEGPRIVQGLEVLARLLYPELWVSRSG